MLPTLLIAGGDLTVLRSVPHNFFLPNVMHLVHVIIIVLLAVGDIIISGGVTLSGNTLTCICTGGPATTVTWTRDSVTVTEGTETVLDDPETATYTHTLTVTSTREYTCTVANVKRSTASANHCGGYMQSLFVTELSY